MKSLKGHLLIASPRLMDPNFVRTVVLMVQHGDEGALGLILNRPLEATVRDVCEKVLESPCLIDAHLHQGGPCEGPLMVLHTFGGDGDDDENAQQQVLPGVYFTAERARIEVMLGGGSGSGSGGGDDDFDAAESSDGHAKFFVGYAGWGAGQLENELETGSWLSAPAEPHHVFDAGGKIWSKLTTWLTAGIDPARIPDDPSVN